MVVRHRNAYYYCVEYTDENGLVTECGNEATRKDILQWIVEHAFELPPGEGKVVNKRTY